MNSLTVFISIILVGSILSCSQLIKQIEPSKVTVKSETDISPKNLSCQSHHKFEIIGEKAENVEAFHQFLTSLKKIQVLSFIDQALLWTLFQLNIRPDLSAPSSRITFYLKINNKEYYRDFSTQELVEFDPEQKKFMILRQMPFMKALDHLSQLSNSLGVDKLTALIDAHYKGKFYVSKKFSKFLIKHQEQLRKSSYESIYIHGEESLIENESIPKISLHKLYQTYNKLLQHQKIHIAKEIPYQEETNALMINCNFDPKLYSESQFLIEPENIDANIFGLISEGNYFLATSTQSINEITPLPYNYIHFVGSGETRGPALCQFNNKNNQNQALLFSYNSRDPAQHLFHHFAYGLDQFVNINSLKSSLQFSRHVFLANPIRLIFESARAPKDQITKLLKLDFPIYHADQLGTIEGIFSSERKKNHFILDDRSSTALMCL